MTDKVFATYDLDSGLAADRPATPSVAGGRLYIYSATDTGAISIWNGTAWVSGGVGPAGQGFTNQGAWSSSGTYNPFDVVTYAGSTWLCYAAVSGSAITPDRDTSHFTLWAAKGSPGSTDSALIPPPFNPLPLELPADLRFSLALTGLY